jgi:NAD(P)-dependent dehydrogenase (short-subunit alcohol dehydrogenase family)
VAEERGAFRDAVALVTGASGALGGVVARRLLDAGARLVLPDREPARLAADFPELAGDGARGFAQPCEITDPESVDELLAAAVDRFGKVDLLVNVAGAFRGGRPVHETPVADWELMWRINATATFLLCRATVPVLLRAGGGAIVNVASGAALAGDAGMAAYSAAKSAVLRLTESLSAEVKERGIRVNAVLPGVIDTAANRRDMPGADTAKWVSPDALADVILFLASPAARAIHGAAVPVFGLG